MFLFCTARLSSSLAFPLIGDCRRQLFISAICTKSRANFDEAAASNESGDERPTNFVSRDAFHLPTNFDKTIWYPKHMGLQMKIMEGKLRTVDLILEVHDARVAITGRNPTFAQKLYSVRPHILVLNKRDLIDMDRYREPIEAYYRGQQQQPGSGGVDHVFWTNSRQRVDSQWDRLRHLMLDLLHREQRFNRAVKTEYQVMVVGIPNVGKSSLINALRKNNLGFDKAVPEGAFPGVTVRVQHRVRIWDRPPIYILDTPGVLNPWVENVHSAMKLAACNLILESATKPHFVADYLLFFMNKYKDFSYLDALKMAQPSDNIDQVLTIYAKLKGLKVKSHSNAFTNHDVWDLAAAATKFLSFFRKGRIKDQFLDRDLLGFRDSSESKERARQRHKN